MESARAAIKANRAVIDLLDCPEGRSYSLSLLGGSTATIDDVDAFYDLAADLLVGPLVAATRREVDWWAASNSASEPCKPAEFADQLSVRPEGAMWFVDGPVAPACGCGLTHPAPAGMVWHRNPDRRTATVAIIGDTSNVPFLERPADLPRHIILGVQTLSVDRSPGDHAHAGPGSVSWALDVLAGMLRSNEPAAV